MSRSTIRAVYTVDVVIPTYNETTRLLRAVSSAAGQIHKPKRILVIDDGSDSEVIDFLKNHIAVIPSVEVLYKAHSGNPGEARRKGVVRASSDWVAFLDADDYWEPSKLSSQLKAAEESQVQFVCTNAQRNSHGELPRPLMPRKKRAQRFTFKDILLSNFVVTSSVLVKRDQLLDCGLFTNNESVKGVEDFATWLRVLSRTSGLYLPELLVNYSYTKSSFSHRVGNRTTADAVEDFLEWSSRNSPSSPGVHLRYFALKLFASYLRFGIWRRESLSLRAESSNHAKR